MVRLGATLRDVGSGVTGLEPGDRVDLVASAHALFDIVGSGKVRIEANQRYALEEAGQAHSDLQARKTTVSTVLVP